MELGLPAASLELMMVSWTAKPSAKCVTVHLKYNASTKDTRILGSHFGKAERIQRK
jgi:hypothetical protein